MKEIEGLSLAELFASTEKEVLSEKRLKVTKQLSGMMTDLENWRRQKTRAESDHAKAMKKLDEKITKATGKLTQIKAGDWSILVDENDPKPERETADAD